MSHMAPNHSPKSPWRGRLVLVATILAMVLLAAHPELRLFVPFLDALGLDVFLMLVGAQVWLYARPVLHHLHRSVALPVARQAYAAGIWVLGMAGPYVHARVSTRWPPVDARALP
jgi:hypothetical protein